MFRIVIGIVCLSAVLTGCSANLHQVKARVDSVAVSEQTDEGVRVLVTITAENPNDVALPIVRAKYEVELPGSGVEKFEFTDLPKATVPANGTQTITLPAAFALNGGDASSRAYKVDGHLTYEPPGEVRKLLTEYGVPLPSAGFESEGALR